MAGIAFLPGIGSLAGVYDALLVDQWGVLHQGRPAGKAVLDALSALKRAGKRVIVLTNSGRRAAESRRRLEALGFAPGLFEQVISSGELAWGRIADRSLSWLGAAGRRCLFFSHDDPDYLQGLDLEATEDPEEADLILNVGVDAAHRSFESYEQVLRRAHRRALPMICANPDLETPDGKRVLYGAGALAARYAEWGGDVTWFGKPHPEIFAVAIDALERTRGARVLVVGDSLIHDVAGARAVGLDSALVADGVHGPELARGGATEEAVGALCARLGVEPDFVLPTFKW